jgi:exonuclease SbcD
MRLLHTADWHLGHTLREWERDREFQAALDWLVATLQSERIDALLIAGDIFDQAVPPAAAQHLWHRLLIDAWRALPQLHIVAIAGNHDHAARLQASAPVLEALGRLHVLGSPDPTRWVVELPASDGPGAMCAALPFLRPSDLPLGLEPLDGFAQVVAAALDQARERAKPGQALVAMGHCYMVGGEVSELSERRIQRGHQDAVPAAVFPSDLAYVALGHLHLAQAVGGREGLRYAGSLLPLSMDERGYRHGVTLVELEGAELRSVRHVPVPRPVELRRIPERGAAPVAEILAAIDQLPERTAAGEAALWPFVEVHVRVEAPDAALRKVLADALAEKAVRVVHTATVLAGGGGALGDDAPDVPSLGQLGEAEVFARKWRLDYGSLPGDDVRADFGQLVAMAKDPGAADRERLARIAPLVTARPAGELSGSSTQAEG